MALVEPMNQAQADKAAAQAEIDAASKQAKPLDVAEIYAMIDSLGDVGATLADARPTALNPALQGAECECRRPARRAGRVRASSRADRTGTGRVWRSVTARLGLSSNFE